VKEPILVDPDEECGSLRADKFFLVAGVANLGNSSKRYRGLISLNYEKMPLCFSLLS
jgi:hypothetical protein